MGWKIDNEIIEKGLRQASQHQRPSHWFVDIDTDEGPLVFSSAGQLMFRLIEPPEGSREHELKFLVPDLPLNWITAR